MKKFLSILGVLLIVTLILAPMFAQAADRNYITGIDPSANAETLSDFPETLDPEPSVPTSPFTWQQLATIAGATVATLLIVQFAKVPLDKIWKIPTRLFVYVVALIIMLVATAFTDGLTPNTALLVAINAFIVALSAYGTYELTFAKRDK